MYWHNFVIVAYYLPCIYSFTMQVEKYSLKVATKLWSFFRWNSINLCKFCKRIAAPSFFYNIIEFMYPTFSNPSPCNTPEEKNNEVIICSIGFPSNKCLQCVLQLFMESLAAPNPIFLLPFLVQTSKATSQMKNVYAARLGFKCSKFSIVFFQPYFDREWEQECPPLSSFFFSK